MKGLVCGQAVWTTHGGRPIEGTLVEIKSGPVYVVELPLPLEPKIRRMASELHYSHEDTMVAMLKAPMAWSAK